MKEDKKENQSSQEELEALKAELEILKNKKEIDSLRSEINLLKKRESFKKDGPNKKDDVSNYYGYKRKGKFQVIFLCFITFGIYGLFLTYDWIKAVNNVRKQQIINPQNYVLVTIFTCTIGSIFYIWRVLKESELIAKETLDLLPDRHNLKPPVKNLKEGWLVFIILSFFLEIISLGISLPGSMTIESILFMQSQTAVIYALDLKARSELLDS